MAADGVLPVGVSAQGADMTAAGVAAVHQPRITVPYVIAYSDELVADPICFVPDRWNHLKLSYQAAKPGDWVDGVLRARVRTKRKGQPQWRKLNTRRQWLCMARLWCQVCGKPARDERGRFPWIMTEKVFRWDEEQPGTIITNAPPTCWTCIPDALASCPQLEDSSTTVYTAGGALPVGVLGDVYRPWAAVALRNVEMRFTDTSLLPYVLAHQLIVRVFDLRSVAA
ncbi:hypothetical protein ACIBG8_21210 [Nonomuraea sp. NPDC050556]|uniref:hypothetical protein n=1 Tax=Nonomuraea sp. NPDC050556 TaxID=3364369 RepID=UPI00379B9196